MKSRRRAVLVAAGLVLSQAFRAMAAGSAAINVDVTILANLSVEVSGSASSTQTVAWNAATPNDKLVSAATATVRNSAGGLTEKWALSTNASSLNTAAGPDAWALAASTSAVGADQFAAQAVFGSSNTVACPAGASSDWDAPFAPPLTASPATYTSTVFADANLTNAGGTPNPDITAGGADGRMHAGSRRALCWRIITPSSTSTVDTQNVQIIVTAVVP